MGQIFVPGTKDIILTDVDRLVARNADGGLSPTSAHVILLGEDAGRNLALSNVVALGEDSLGGGGTGAIDTANLDGSIAIGSDSAGLIQSGGTAGPSPYGNITLGRRALAVALFASGNVIIGDQAVEANTPATGSPTQLNVIIGSGAVEDFTNGPQLQQNVVIGHRAGNPAAANPQKDLLQSVIIGASAASNYAATGTNGLHQAVIIGSGAGLNVDGRANSMTAVGANAGTTIASTGCVAIGASANCVGVAQVNQTAIGNATQTNAEGAIVIGATSTSGANATHSTLIGYNATIGVGSANTTAVGSFVAGLTGARHILLGSGCAVGEPAANTDKFIVETFVGAVRRGVLYGDLTTGCIALGLTTPAVNRDLGGAGATNLVKILNGATGAAAPVGGLFLFGVAGDLRMQAPGPVERVITGVFTVATLPGAGGRAGSSAFVTDALAPAFGAAVAGGGAVFTPVYCDGVNWLVG